MKLKFQIRERIKYHPVKKKKKIKMFPLLLGNQDKSVQVGPEIRSKEKKLSRIRAVGYVGGKSCRSA